MAKIKRLPSGISDFKQVRREDKYYVDKTQYIEKMEMDDNFLFLIRPRRFGKSIFLSMLSAYYDIAESANFHELFKDLWIESHPTPEQGKYQVVYLDFSRIGGKMDNLYDNFNSYCNIVLNAFAHEYVSFYPDGYEEELKAMSNSSAKFNYINSCAKATGAQLYLIVDEYDNFTNTVLNEQGEEIYHALTHASGFYRDVFKLFKGMFSRILMMGVNPVTLDDLTSGYNIASNITLKPMFNMMLGFSEDDVRQMIRYYKSVGMLNADDDAMIAEMKPWYDNYCFSEDALMTDSKMFNCDMVTYYLSNYIKMGKSPRQMTDPNTRTDYNKMRKLIQLDCLDGNRKGVLHEIAENGFVYSNIVDSFPASGLTNPDNFVSLLFYYGMLTITDTYGATLKLSIPNNNVRKQYYDYLMDEYQEIKHVDMSALSMAYADAAIKGKWRNMMEYILNAYKETTSVRSLIEGERNLQGFMNAYFNLNPYYVTAPEVEVHHGYCDFFMMPELHRYPMIAHSYIIELKYLKKEDTEEMAAKQWTEAVEQIHGYGKGEKVRLLTEGTQLHLVVAQIKGYETIKLEEV